MLIPIKAAISIVITYKVIWLISADLKNQGIDLSILYYHHIVSLKATNVNM